MHKFALVAAATAAVGGAAFLIIIGSGGAHAQTSAGAERTATGPGTTAAARSATKGHASAAPHGDPHCLPSLAALVGGASAGANDSAGTDCATVGRHLAELEGDATHGPANRPDEETCEKCAAHYTAACESEGWSEERRSCTLAAADLINAHLCAGSAGTAPAADAPTSIPAHLACAVLGTHVATTAQAAGFHSDVADLHEQIEAACELGKWSIELRQCFATATTIDALQACVMPRTK